MSDSPTDTVTDNAARSRYEMTVDGDTAFIDHVGEGDAIAFTHTKVPESMEGKGVGSKLVKGALEDAHRRGLKVVPRCPFVREYVARHPEYQDIMRPVPGNE